MGVWLICHGWKVFVYAKYGNICKLIPDFMNKALILDGMSSNNSHHTSSSLRIYQASAGSGKTFRLAGDYLRLLFSDPLKYRHILAVTFTHKATSEMKTRILEELNALSGSAKSGYLEELRAATGMGEGQIREKAGQILRLILHDYSRFSVGTIDSFFQRILQQFAREIGMPGGYTVELNTDRVLDEAIDRMISSLSSDILLRNWLTDFALERIGDGQSWDIIGLVRQLGTELFRESYQAIERSRFKMYEDKGKLKEAIARLRKTKNHFETRLRSIAGEALEIIALHDLQTSDFKFASGSFANYFNRMMALKELEPGSRTRSAPDNAEDWITKGSPQEKAIRHAYENGLNDRLKEAIEHYDSHHAEYNTACLVLQHIYITGILTDLDAHIRSFLKDDRLFLLADAGHFLRRIIGPEEVPFIYERTGNRFRHFMIDEFQDTSHFQWENFLPLVSNSLSENHNNLLVGDVKQSIYRWRNSDWHILASEIFRQFPEDRIEKVPLDTNWRSLRNIVGFNNAFFSSAANILQKHYESEAPDQGNNNTQPNRSLINAYQGLEQKLPGNGDREGGYVRISFHDKKNDEEAVLSEIPLWLEKLQDAGFRPGRVAILVRWNKEGVKVVRSVLDYIEQGKGKKGYSYLLASGESLMLRTALTVQFIMAVLRHIMNPADKVNSAHLGLLYYRYILGENNQPEILEGLLTSAGKNTGGENQVVTGILEDLKSKLEMTGNWSLYEQVERIVQVFELNRFENETPFLLSFQDVVMDFQKQHSGDIYSFLKWWDERGSSDSSLRLSEDELAFRIFTIHKAKGLEFDAVLVPFCKWGLGHERSHLLWCATKGLPFDQPGVVGVNYSEKMASSGFSPEYWEERMNACVDNLNLLYVAFTRAIKALIVWVQMPSKGKSLTHTGVLVYQVLTMREGNQSTHPGVPFVDIPSGFRNEENVFETGTLSCGPDERQPEAGINPFVPEIKITAPPHSRLRLRQESLDYFVLTGSTAGEQVNRGRILHELFERISTPAEVEKVLQSMSREGRIRKEDIDQMKNDVSGWLSHEKAQEWFSPEWEVKAEAGIYLPGGGERRPDRVLIKGKHAIVVDYKFGEAEEDKYIKQVRHYARLLLEMGYTPVEGYIWYVTLGKVVPVQVDK